ncbi:MAG: putative peptidoglycan biosynthesis protein MurJ [bacterium ADurb.BinA186]|nr:MAG: putative peptidoglycan biosynthesis protein MurJ [bacterium ADurb.BinA186]
MGQIIKLMIPRAIGLGANQILLVAYTVIASSFPGAIAIYSFADNIQTVPSVIFGISFAQAIFPTLASLSIDNCQEKEKFEKLIAKSIRVSLFLLIPSTAAILLLRAQIIRLILGYGFFGWSDTKAASLTLGFFALSIVAQGLIPMLARGFYALCNTKLPMISSLVSITIAILLGYLFSNSSHPAIAGVPGLALAYSVGSWVNLAILAIFLSIEIKLELKKIIYHALKIIVLTLFASLVIQIVKDVVATFFDIDRVRFLLLQAFSALALGGAVYLLGAWIFDLSGRNEK